MPVDRELFVGRYKKNRIHAFPCPTCHRGHTTEAEDASPAMSLQGRRYFNNEDFWGNYEKIHWIYSDKMKCSNNSCKQEFVVTGDGAIDLDLEDYCGEQNGPDVADFHTPRFIYPAPELIPIPVKTPEVIVRMLVSSWVLFWLDLDAASNRLRSTLEAVLVEKGVEPQVKTLGRKMLEFKKIDPDTYDTIENKLDASRILGNDGSHSLGKMEREDVFNLYDLVESILLVFYADDDTYDIDAIAEKIRSRR